MPGGTVWDRFSLDPRHADHARLRASDADRDIVNDLLGTAYAEGRLTPEELDERTDRVTRSRTLGDLPPIIDDLVATSPALTQRGGHRAEAETRYRQQRANAFWGFLTPTLICWAIWAATMFGEFPWPLIVTIASGAKFLQLVTTPAESIASIERELEKKERKRLEAKKDRGPDPG